MRFIRNEVQTPKHLVAPEKRRSLPFLVLLVGVSIMVMGVAAFFSAFFFRDLIQERWELHYRVVQTNAIYVTAAGIALYVIGAVILKIPLRKTTYYKVTTVVKNEPYDPPRKGDFSKAIYARLRDLGDEWAFFTEVRPAQSNTKIPQLIVGPGGVFATQPIAENPERKAFVDPGPDFEKASQKLGNAIGQPVLPMVVFSNPKLVLLYKTYRNPKVRVMNIREIFDFFNKQKKKYSEKVQAEIERKVLELIDGTPADQ